MNKVYILIMRDGDIRPRSDIVTSAVFATEELAMDAMEHEIASAIEGEMIGPEEIERCAEQRYAASSDGRFAWKVEERRIRTA